jgi:16S rRNA (cytosine967-C5)-methyltransferase
MMNVRLEAYKIIYKVLKKKLFSDQLLRQKKAKFKDPDDNVDLLYMLVKGVIKMHKNLDYLVSSFVDPQKYKNTDLKIKIILYLALYQLRYCDNIPDYAAVDESVKLAKKLLGENVSGFINGVLRNFLRNNDVNYPEAIVTNLAVQYSFPENLIETWINLWGESATTDLCEYFNQIPKINLRVNCHATHREKLLDYFHRRQIELTISPASENILKTDRVHEVLHDVAFSEGYYSVQDASAALVIELMKPAPHESILDLFAAPGGKTTYAAELMGNTGEIIAIDKFPNKIKKLKQAIIRLQLTNIKAISEDAFRYGPRAPAFDKVLLDVPCSGWGVFQKKAELRWQGNQDIPKLLKLQEAALKTGSQFVKPGGYLIYSTCTLNPYENELQVNRFLQKNSNFKLEPAGKYLPKNYVENNFLRTLPFLHDMDGAFGAKLKRLD